MTKITILCENTAGAPGMLGEHGFAALIETPSGAYLFDTGQGHTILHNAQQLRKKLNNIQMIFLSHGHYDHCGGITKVLSSGRKIAIRTHPDIFSRRYARRKSGGKHITRNVGIPYSQKTLEKCGASFQFNTSFAQVTSCIYLTGEVPRRTEFEKGDRRLVVKKHGVFVKDPLRDDQSLIIDTEKGLVVILGCAHAGVINILSHIKKHLPGRRIYMLVGGMHLGFLTEHQLSETIKELKSYAIKHIGVSHCTGLAASCKVIQELGDKCFFANAGTSIAI